MIPNNNYAHANQGYVDLEETRKVINIFGRKYLLRKSAERKYKLMGQILTGALLVLSGWVIYVYLWSGM